MIRRIFVDTNVMLDLLAWRQPYYEPIARIATLAEMEKLVMVASPISFTTCSYFLTENEGSKSAFEKLRKFKIVCEICNIGAHTIEKALTSSFKDFEDAVQYFNAMESKCEVIITRNPKDFKKSLISVMSADAFLKSIEGKIR